MGIAIIFIGKVHAIYQDMGAGDIKTAGYLKGYPAGH